MLSLVEDKLPSTLIQYSREVKLCIGQKSSSKVQTNGFESATNAIIQQNVIGEGDSGDDG